MSCCVGVDRGSAELADKQPVSAGRMLPFGRPRLFNWITILLVTVWVGLVAVIVEVSRPSKQAVSVDTFVESLAN